MPDELPPRTYSVNPDGSLAEPPLYRVVSVNPYLDTEEEFGGMGLLEAAHRADDLTGVGADVILADLDPDTGEDPFPWEWVDEETGREVTIRQEVSP